jgi:hypothetical protein
MSILGSFRENHEKYVAKWVASYVVRRLPKGRPITDWLDEDVLKKDRGLWEHAKALDLAGIHFDVRSSPNQSWGWDSSWNLDGTISIGCKVPKETPLDEVYRKVFAMALHELTHAVQALRNAPRRNAPTPLDYALDPEEVEAYLKQFKALLRHRDVTLEEVVQDWFKELVPASQMPLVVSTYRKAYQRMFGKEAP